MANLNTAISPAPVITSFTKGGIVASGYTGDVTMTLLDNPSGASLGGTTTVTASGGVATFSNLTLNRSGIGFTLRATGAAQGGVTPRAVTSRPFSIPTQLVFTTQPTSVAAPYDILPLFVVTARDSAGNTDTSYNGEVTVSLYTGASLGVLSGLFTRNAISGVANFSGLSIDSEGTYSFKAEGGPSTIAATPSAKVSNTFSVGGTLVAASFPVGGGTDIIGFIDGSGGSVSPTTFGGQDITLMGTEYDGMGVVTGTGLWLTGTLSQSFFTTFNLNGTPLLSSAATYSTAIPGFTSWTWTGVAVLSVAGTYTYSIQ